jgi:hypothetical protein
MEDRQQSLLEVQLGAVQIIAAVQRMKKEERAHFIEDLLAATSPEYLDSIEQARDDYEQGRVKSIEEVFGGFRYDIL